MRRAAILLAVAGVASCARAPAPPPEHVRYTVGDPYQLAGAWYYPNADFSFDASGLAAVAAISHAPLTADGERYDPTAMAAGHRTLQLPAVVRVTNLDAGLSALVRLNDRGPAAPGRLIEVTPRVADLLKIQDGSRVRVQVAEGESRTLAAATEGGSPTLAIATAPAGTVSAVPLAPPPGTAASTRGRDAAPMPATAAAAVGAVADVPARLPEIVTRAAVAPGPLYVDVGSFTGVQYARLQQARLASLGAQIAATYATPGARAFAVRLGPFATVADADAALDRARRAGVTDASIVVGP